MAHIALQELQAVVLMLDKMAFWSHDKVVTLHLDNGTARLKTLYLSLLQNIIVVFDNNNIL